MPVHPKALFVARQPIFDASGKVWGYELLYRESMEAETAQMEDEEASTLQVAASRLLLPDHDFSDANCVINVTRDFLLRGYGKGLPPERLALSLPQGLAEDPEVLEAMAELRAEGVKCSLTLQRDCNVSQKAIEHLDLLECPAELLDSCDTDLLQQCKARGTLLLASRLETHEQRDAAKDLGADLFQGFFFRKPRTYSHKPFATSIKHRLQILQLLEDPRQDVDELAAIVQGEVRLAVRLLALVNSAAFALAHKVDSVRRAISLIGWRRIKNWLHLIVVSDMTSGQASLELAYTSAIRAKFLELLALETERAELAERLYLLGLFSFLESLLEKPMAEILDALKLDCDVAAALKREQGVFAPWLQLTELLESGNWVHLGELAQQLELDMHTISHCKLEALAWANTFFRELN